MDQDIFSGVKTLEFPLIRKCAKMWSYTLLNLLALLSLPTHPTYPPTSTSALLLTGYSLHFAFVVAFLFSLESVARSFLSV